MADTLKLGIQFGYWTAQPRVAPNLVTAARGAEELGYDSVWTGESWSSDAFSPLAAVAAATDRIHLWVPDEDLLAYEVGWRARGRRCDQS